MHHATSERSRWLSRRVRRLVVLVALAATLPGGVAGAALGPESFPAATVRTPAHDQSPNSADRVVFWTRCEDLLRLGNAELDRWHRNGVGGLACGVQLAGLGGDQ